MTPKHNERFLNGSVRYPLSRKKLKIQKSHIKTVLIIFFDPQGVEHKEFVPERITVNAEIYKAVIDLLLKSNNRVRPTAFCSRDLPFSTTMGPPTNVLGFAIFDRKNFTTSFHPPQSPDLSPTDYFLFSKMKMNLKGLHYAEVAEIQKAVNNELKHVKKRGIFAVAENVRLRKSLYI
jgi:hypothetical protein